MTPERKRFSLYVMIYSMAGSAIARIMLAPCPPWLPIPYLHGLLALFGLLLIVSTHTLRNDRRVWLYTSLGAQTIIALSLMLLLKKETAAMLLFSVGLQGLLWLPLRESYAWLLGLTIATTLALIGIYGPLNGLAVAPVYGSALLFMGIFTYLLDQQEKATATSQHFLEELHEAYQKLKRSTAQAQELATTKERNRIARELHDSVTQMLFSMNLLAQTTKVMAQDQAPALSPHLDQLQELAQDALSEMRYLIFQLRPSSETEKGLLPALRQHITHLESRHALQVELDAEQEPPLSHDQIHKLFRITQEALNNVVKHAQTDTATVRLTVQKEAVTLSVEDKGVGFAPPPNGVHHEPDTAPHQERVGAPESNSMGLDSMKERADLLGASFACTSQRGQGTQIQVTLPLANQGHEVATP